MTTWNAEFVNAKHAADDTSDLVAYAPHAAAFAVEFDNDFGATEGPQVIAWTEQRVYFPVCYDGAEWMGSAPRHPQTEGQRHVGGG